MADKALTYNEFKDALKDGRLLGMKCRGCGGLTTPPRGVCGSCGSFDYEVVDVKPSGTVRTFTVIRVPPMGYNAPYIVGMVELDEGPWMMGNIEGIAADEAGMDLIGRKVSVSARFFPPPEEEAGLEGLALTFDLTG